MAGLSHRRVIIVGAGQAGLATAAALIARGMEPQRDFVLIDRSPRARRAWSARRPFMRLLSSAEHSSFPRRPLEGDPYRHPTPRDIESYLHEYEAELGVKPVWGVRAFAVTPHNNGPTLRLSTTVGEVQTRNIVCATGAAARPRLPEWAADADVEGARMHTSAYQTPEQIPPGQVLIVGGGNAGVEVASDLANSHDVTLAVRTRRTEVHARQFPTRPHFSPWRRAKAAQEPLYGHSYDALRGKGVHIQTETTGVRGDEFTFSDGSRQTYQSVIFATGYEAGDEWLPTFPQPQRRIRTSTALPGLFVAGIPTHSHAKANTLPGAWADATRIARLIHARP